MKQIKMILLAGIAVMLMTACGGGGSTDSSGSSGSSGQDYHFASGSTVKFTLLNDENIIIGGGCTFATVYDMDNVKIGTTSSSLEPIPEPLTRGEYTASFSEVFGKYTDSVGVLYYASSGLNIDNLKLSTNINVYDRRADIYRLSVSSTSSFVINTTSVDLEVYDSSLNSLGSTYTFSGPLLPDPLTLDSGVYYFLVKPILCAHGGSFSITPL